MKIITTEFTKYIESILVENDTATSYQGYIFNHHETLVLYVKCSILDYSSHYTRVFKINPKEKIKVMNHLGELFFGFGEVSFEVIGVFDQPPADKKKR